MKSAKLFGVVALALAFAPMVGALTADGNLGDWGVSIPAAVNAPGGWASSIGQFAVDDGQIGPGGGGQNFDIEAMYAHVVGNTLYFAMTTGFDQGGEVGDAVFLPHYDGGDIFFNFGGVSGYNVAVRIAEASVPGNGPINSTGIGNVYVGDFSESGNSFLNTEDVYIAGFGAETNPWRVDDTAVGGLGVQLVDTIAIGYTDGVAPDHNVYEFALDLSALGFNPIQTASQGFSVHWTMECGNDVMDWSVPGQIIVVPEPASMTLLGLGLAGILIRRRRNR
jgi:hypothetical protein